MPLDLGIHLKRRRTESASTVRPLSFAGQHGLVESGLTADPAAHADDELLHGQTVEHFRLSEWHIEATEVYWWAASFEWLCDKSTRELTAALSPNRKPQLHRQLTDARRRHKAAVDRLRCYLKSSRRPIQLNPSIDRPHGWPYWPCRPFLLQPGRPVEALAMQKEEEAAVVAVTGPVFDDLLMPVCDLRSLSISRELQWRKATAAAGTQAAQTTSVFEASSAAEKQITNSASSVLSTIAAAASSKRARSCSLDCFTKSFHKSPPAKVGTGDDSETEQISVEQNRVRLAEAGVGGGPGMFTWLMVLLLLFISTIGWIWFCCIK
uniref:Uncharacterized protein n=1 Tax=Macrostomum lignano TaxID=282301 RepID=A0A1I8JR64_9PLAT